MQVLHPTKFGFILFCPGCQRGHGIWVTADPGPNWKFNGNVECPTFEPSVKITGTDPATEEDQKKMEEGKAYSTKPSICHFHVIDGNIIYYDDTTHHLKGQTIRMEPL